MLKNLIFPMLSVCERAAIESSSLNGLGERKSADRAAVESMRKSLNEMEISGRIAVGEGERDEAPMLYTGEMLGRGGQEIDIAVDPLEGTNLCALNRPGALTVLAYAERGAILHTPDVYMEKLIVHPDFSHAVDFSKSLSHNIHALASAKNVRVDQLRGIVLLRDRHEAQIKEARALGLPLTLIDDGDISAAISILSDQYDIYFGSGGAPEGVLAAAVFKAWGSGVFARLVFRNGDEISRARKCGIDDLEKIYSLKDLIRSDSIFIATGVTDGELVGGARRSGNKIETESVVFDSTERGFLRIKRKKMLEAR